MNKSKGESLRHRIRMYYNAGANLEALKEKFKHLCTDNYIRNEYNRNMFLNLYEALPKIQGNFAEKREAFSVNEMDYAPRLNYKLEDLTQDELNLFNDKNHDTLKEPCKI